MKPAWKLGLRYLMGLLFCLSGVFKLVSIGEFELYVFSFGFVSFDTATILARGLVAGEIILGLGFISGCYYRLVCWICAFILGFFSVFLLWRMFLGDESNCHCFGELLQMPPRWSLLKNVGFAIMLCAIWNQTKTLKWIKPTHVLYGAVGSVLLVLTLVFSCNPPDVFVRKHNQTQNIVKELLDKKTAADVRFSEGRKIVCFYGTSCKYCVRCAKKINGIVERNKLNKTSFLFVFMETDQDMTSKVATFFKEHIVDSSYPYTTLPPLDFLSLTNGSMPVVAFLDSGKLIKEYNYITLKEDEMVEFLSLP